MKTTLLFFSPYYGLLKGFQVSLVTILQNSYRALNEMRISTE